MALSDPSPPTSGIETRDVRGAEVVCHQPGLLLEAGLTVAEGFGFGAADAAGLVDGFAAGRGAGAGVGTELAG